MTNPDAPFPVDDPRHGHVDEGPDAGGLDGTVTYVEEVCGAARSRGGRPGAVTVLEAEGTKVVSFEFDAGDVLREHATHHAVLIQVIRGRVDFEVQGRTLTLTPGRIVHLTPMLRHAVTAIEPSTLTVTMLLGH